MSHIPVSQIPKKLVLLNIHFFISNEYVQMVDVYVSFYIPRYEKLLVKFAFLKI